MSKTTDDLEAVRVVVSTLEGFEAADRERILRWAREKLGMASEEQTPKEFTPPLRAAVSEPYHAPAAAPDIRTFINEKDPKSDNHLAAVVAYYHQFKAPLGEQKEAITKEDLIEACRKADRKRPARPAQVLVNSFHAGLLDKPDRAHYRLNSVGENLVAMVLPEGPRSSSGTTRVARSRKKQMTKRSPKKKAVSKKTSRSKRS